MEGERERQGEREREGQREGESSLGLLQEFASSGARDKEIVLSWLQIDFNVDLSLNSATNCTNKLPSMCFTFRRWRK
jgi:hypothetical protein